MNKNLQPYSSIHENGDHANYVEEGEPSSNEKKNHLGLGFLAVVHRQFELRIYVGYPFAQ